MRCLAVAEEFSQRGAECFFICRDHEGGLLELIEGKGFRCFVLRHSFDYDRKTSKDTSDYESFLGVSWESDATESYRVLEVLKPNWLIVDHYALDARWESEMADLVDHILIIDDLGNRRHLCTALIDQNLGSTTNKYRHLVPEACELFLGPKFAMLRPEFAEWRKFSLTRRSLEPKEPVRRILVSLGGTDSQNYTVGVLNELAQTQLRSDVEILVVLGATSPHEREVSSVAATMPYRTIVRKGVDNIAEEMSKSDLAIGAAGSTTWERCCMGLATIQIVIAENQNQIAEAVGSAEIAKVVDDLSELRPLVETVDEWRGAIERNCASVCDGLAIGRLVDYMVRESN